MGCRILRYLNLWVVVTWNGHLSVHVSGVLSWTHIRVRLIVVRWQQQIALIDSEHLYFICVVRANRSSAPGNRDASSRDRVRWDAYRSKRRQPGLQEGTTEAIFDRVVRCDLFMLFREAIPCVHVKMLLEVILLRLFRVCVKAGEHLFKFTRLARFLLRLSSFFSLKLSLVLQSLRLRYNDDCRLLCI